MDTTKKIQCKEYCHDDGKYHWDACDINYAVRNITTALRIKPKELIYEWQWYYIENGEGINAGWFTYEEISDKHDDIQNERQFYVMQETKRERKQ